MEFERKNKRLAASNTIQENVFVLPVINKSPSGSLVSAIGTYRLNLKKLPYIQ